MSQHFSPFLEASKEKMQQLVSELEEHFTFASILGCDVGGTRYDVSKYENAILVPMWNSRGFVVRAFKDGSFLEYAFNEFPEDVRQLVKDITSMRRLVCKRFPYSAYEETAHKESYSGPCIIRPDAWSPSQYIRTLKDMLKEGMRLSRAVVDLKFVLEVLEWSKLYVSRKRELSQDYCITQGYVFPIVRRKGNTKYAFYGFSRMGGLEEIEPLRSEIEPVIREALMLLDSEPITPGEYEVVCSPEISGLIAHEAFGHGVEMDMFVKNRAKSREYMGKRVGSDLVYMHDGAQAAKHQPASYLFDDEGILGSDTEIIEKGMLKSGISDLLSALRLNIKPTGNGRRESYERKAYARMTNTFFEPGTYKKEELIRSIPYGVLLEKMSSGMEDPKNWGIQCMVLYGREIRDGRLTGKVFSPIIMTGYVPELLSNISMVSDDFELFASGACGKGYKESVKVSDGGPYIKMKARLG
jgi:TldD protein